MRSLLISAIAIVAFVSFVNCGCDRSSEQKPSDDGEVTQFFKNLGCDIKKQADKVSDSAKPYIDDIKRGAGKVSESAKPYIDDIGNTAKKIGGSVADRFNDLKDKISGNADNATVVPESSSSSSPLAETKKADDGPVLLANSSTPSTPLASTSEITKIPEIEDRFILDIKEPKCPEKTKNDGRGHCRSTDNN